MKNHHTIVPKTSVSAPPIAKNGGTRMKSMMNHNTSNTSTSTSSSTSQGGLVFLSTSKKQVPQQQEALLSALGYNPVGKGQDGDKDGAMKPSVWGVTTITNTKSTSTTNTTSTPNEKVTGEDPSSKGLSLSLDEDKNKHHHLHPNEAESAQNGMHPVTKDVPPSPQTETGTTNMAPNNIVNDQVEYMRQLAKSRAERKRQEEESRILEQKERAAARLMALERKLGKTNSTGTTSSTRTTARTTTILEKKQQDSSMHHDSILQPSPTKEEPNTTTDAAASNNDKTRLVDNTNSNTSPQPMEKMNIPNYYENRKSSSTSTGPRMLFDPKSGSMVAAPLSNVNSSSLKVSKQSNKSRSKKNSSSTMTVKSNVHDVDQMLNGKIKRGNTNVTAAHAVTVEKIVVENKYRGKRTTHGNKESKIPRTCGVLYTRDEHGSYISADGCDGDQGYGYHLFPGGRIRNLKAYEAYEKEHLEGTLMYNNDTNTTNGSTRLVHNSIMQHTNSLENGSGYRPSVTPLNRSHFMRKPLSNPSVGVSDERTSSSLLKSDKKLDLLTDLDESPKLQATAAVWAPSQAVLELTAAAKMKSQQPSIQHDDEISETGLHAMNAMAIIDNVMNTEQDEEDQEEEDDSKRHFGESPSVGLGLGFDPTKNMDSVMMSPTMDAVDANDLNISNLELSPENSSNMAVSGSTKSILGSSPWATTNTTTTGHSAHPSMGSLSNWDFTSHHSKNAESKNESSASFLSFGGLGRNQNTWGSTSSRLSKGFHGIGGS